MERLKLVQMHINRMTNDEDHKQELWLRYLEGEPLSSLENILSQIKEDQEQQEALKSAIWSVMKNPPSEKFEQILSRFTQFERKVMLSLALGCSTSQISRYNGISEVRVCQLISNIRRSKEWENFYGSKEKSERR